MSSPLFRSPFGSAMVLAAVLSGITLICSCSRQRTPERPNILFLLTDDQQAPALGVMGHPIVQTPNLDRLAREGVLFRQMHVTDPTCSPSRTTFFTGQYERVHGVGFSSTHRMTQAQWAQTYPALLRQAGYYTGFIGKFGVEYYEFNSREKFDFWRAHDGWARFFPKPRDNCEIYRDSQQDIITPIMGESVERFLDSLPADKPFCLQVSFSAPHGSITSSMDVPDGNVDILNFAMTQPANLLPAIAHHPIYGELYRNIDIPLPSTYTEDTGKYLPKRIYDPRKYAAKVYAYDFTRERCREHHIRYYQCIRGIDEVVGGILRSLERRGLAGNTVIIFGSDHGLLLGDYGMGGKALLYDLTTRIPFLIYDPRLPADKRGRQLDELLLSADVAPTILSLAGVPVPGHMQGRDLTPLVNGTATEWRDAILTENLYIGRMNPFQEGVRTSRWKYIRYYVAREQDLAGGKRLYNPVLDLTTREPDFEHLFDLEADPGETKNLAGNPGYADVLRRLRGRWRGMAKDLVAKARLERGE